jgi:hypothetical protein
MLRNYHKIINRAFSTQTKRYIQRQSVKINELEVGQVILYKEPIATNKGIFITEKPYLIRNIVNNHFTKNKTNMGDNSYLVCDYLNHDNLQNTNKRCRINIGTSLLNIKQHYRYYYCDAVIDKTCFREEIIWDTNTTNCFTILT